MKTQPPVFVVGAESAALGPTPALLSSFEDIQEEFDRAARAFGMSRTVQISATVDGAKVAVRIHRQVDPSEAARLLRLLADALEGRFVQ